MADPKAVHPRIKDERAYRQRIRRRVLDPLMLKFVRRLSQQFLAADTLLNALERDYNDYLLELGDIPQEEAERQIEMLEAYHRQKLLTSFSTAFGVNIGSLLNTTTDALTLQMRIQENARLISSIPSRFKDDVVLHITQTIEKHGLDQQQLSKTLKKRFTVANNRVTLITRDQTSKTIGELNKLRHQQLGITEYYWVTSGDERVRSSHAVLNGTLQSWDNPPSTGHPGHAVQCRCTARPKINKSELLAKMR